MKIEFVKPEVQAGKEYKGEITRYKLDESKILPDTLFRLSIILKEKGLGEYITNIFDINFFSPKPFLYSEIHDYCAIIVFEYEKYDTIMNSAYEIVEEYPYFTPK